MNNLLDLFTSPANRVDYCIVHNPAKVRNQPVQEIQHRSGTEKVWGQGITLPVVTSITLLAIKRAKPGPGAN